jgi:hypothetical protein
MEIEVVGVHRHAWILELDDQFNAIAFGASVEIEQGVLVETQLSENAIQAWLVTFSHKCIVKAIGKNVGLTEGIRVVYITRSAAPRSDPAARL